MTFASDEPASPDPGDGGLIRLRLDLGYDGTDFAGWARQPGQRTVQETLEVALATVLRVPSIALTCAGRTDAGVHARGQVAHADVPATAYDQDGSRLVRRLAGVLPPDLRVYGVRAAPGAFDARFSALSRRYVYRVSDSAYGVDPLRRHEVLWHQRRLELAPMNEASALMLGEHDFLGFCRRREGATTRRNLLNLAWARDPTGVITATVEANAFCHNMVRSLVGALLAVGSGQQPVEWPAQLLKEPTRDPRVHVVPPHGLTLEYVAYPPDAELVRAS